MIIEIKLIDKNRNIVTHVLEQSIITYMTHAIDKFRMPIYYEHNCHSFILKVENEEVLYFYLESILQYYSYNLIDVISNYLHFTDIIYKVTDNDGNTSELLVADAEELNNYFGKEWF